VTYQTDESNSLDPVELYKFTFGAQTWLFTDAAEQWSLPDVPGQIYLPEAIQRDNMSQSEEDGSMSVNVTVDALNPIADFFRAPFLPAQMIWLTIYRMHVGSADYASIFTGRVGQCVFSGATAKLTCVPVRNALGKRLPVQLVQLLCNNTLYDGRCKADPSLFTNSATITAINGLTLTVTWSGRNAVARPEGWFDGGFISKAGTPAATIQDDLLTGGATLKLLYNPGYIVGDVINAYAGCDKRHTTCYSKFNNTAHYNGFPAFPKIDPFTSEIV
jgi:uncharacterized phage protein (TIGR02218 family)